MMVQVRKLPALRSLGLDAALHLLVLMYEPIRRKSKSRSGRIIKMVRSTRLTASS